VYSLGATLYECLTGRVPFTGETAEQIFHQILEREPLAPRALAPHLSRDLETVLLKSLEKEPARRYASAAAFADDLDAVLGHRPVAARPVGTWTRAAKWARRNPNGALAAGLALLLVGGLPSAIAVVQTRSAAKVRRERDASDGIRLASQSALALPTDPGLALILARESHARSASVFSRSALFAALEACQESRTFAGHASSGTAVAWGPDGTSVLSASQAGAQTRWSAADGGVLGRWPHPAAVWEIVVLPDGSGFFTACADGRIRRYGWDDADPALEIAAHRRSVLGLVRHPRDSRLLSRSADATACVFDPATGAELLRVGEPGRSTVSSAEFHPSRNEFLTGSYDGTVRVWDGASGAELARMSGADREIRWAVWSPDGGRILAADIGGSAWLWNASDGAVLRAWQQIQHAVDGGFAADGTVLLTTAADRLERIALGRDEALESWSLGEAIASIRPLETGGHLIGLASGDLWWLDASGRIAGPLLGHSAVLIAGAFQAQGSRLATTATDGTVRIWEPRRPGLRRTILRAPATIRGLAWSGDGRTLVVALESGEILRAEAPDFVPHAAFLAPEGFNSNLLASTARHALRSSWSNRTHSGRLAWLDCDEGRELWHLDSATMGLAAPDFERGLLVAHRGRGRLEAFDLDTGATLRELAGSDANPVKAAACAGGGAAAALLRDGTVQVVDVGDGAMRAEFPPGVQPRQEVSISRDGGTVAWSSPDGWLEVMDVAGGSRLARIRAIGLREHRFTGDGALLLAPADELWVWRRGMARPEPLGKIYNISSHATSADPAGRWISSGDSDGRLHLWRQSDLVEELVVDGWPSQFDAHALAPDGARAAVACGTRLDVVEIADLPELAERRVPRAATAAERERYGLRD
jgi:WD40 repeat protein